MQGLRDPFYQTRNYLFISIYIRHGLEDRLLKPNKTHKT